MPVRPAPRRFFNSGTAFILAFVLVFVAGWFIYRPYIPPAWLHDLGAEIALRAAADPNAPPPKDIREATPRGLADSPYICVAKVVSQPWDRLVIVAAGKDVRANPTLAGARWPTRSLESVSDQMARDNRYQLIVLLQGDSVIDAQLFYTFWGTLDAIARPEGFAPAEAIFTAASRGGIYVLAHAGDAPPGACPPSM